MRKNAWWLAAALLVIGCGGKTGDTTNVQGARTLAGSSDPGVSDGNPATARFHNPVNVLCDTDGTVYVADFDNGRVRKIATSGTVSTLVNQAGFSRPFGLANGPAGTLYVSTDADDAGVTSNGTIWKVNKATGVATKIPGSVGRPRGLGVLSTGQLLLSDVNRHALYTCDPDTGVRTLLAGGEGVSGFADGTGAAARFNRPYGVAILPGDIILVADQSNHRIRKVTKTGVVTTFAGSGAAGATNGDLLSASFTSPQDLGILPDGKIVVADPGAHNIRVMGDAFVSNLAGSGVRGFAEGSASTCMFWGLEGLDVQANGDVVIADGTGGDDDDPPYNRVRIFTP